MPRPQDLSFRCQLGDAIIARRHWLAISQVDLAERLEISPTQMGRYERGLNDMTAIMLARLATALGTSPNDLLGYTAPEGSDAHLTVLSDPDIAGVIRAMLRIDPVERASLRRIAETFCERTSV